MMMAISPRVKDRIIVEPLSVEDRLKLHSTRRCWCRTDAVRANEHDIADCEVFLTCPG